MKHRLIYIFLFISTVTFGQNAIADLKFEEAEIAFNNGNYDLTLKKVDEYEKAKGNITAKSLYLRVVAQDKLFSPDSFYADEKQLTLYNSLVTNSDKYLKAMENEGLDDKYREVYRINEKLKELNLPKDKAGWQKNKVLKEQNESDVKDKFGKFNLIDMYVSGEDFKTTREKHKVKRSQTLDYNIFKGAHAYRTGYKRIDLSEYVFTFADDRGKRQMQVLFYYFDDKAVSYECLWAIEDNSSFSNGTKQMEKEKAYYVNLLGFEPKKELDKYDAQEFAYIWQLGEKTFRIKLNTLDMQKLNLGNGYKSHINYTGFDLLKAYTDLK